MKPCTTTVARALGYIKTAESMDHNDAVTILGPMTGQMTSYHQGGLSNKELWKRSREHIECVKREFRL
jgi:hypothetical protein